MRLVAERRGGNLRQRRPVGAIADLAPYLHRPACIDILLVRFFGFDLRRCDAGREHHSPLSQPADRERPARGADAGILAAAA